MQEDTTMRSCAAVVLAFVIAGQASADFIYWDPAQGGNGHYYGLVMPDSTADNFTWTAARDAAAAMTFEGAAGHLVTVTSQAENGFLGVNFASQLHDYAPLHDGQVSTYAWIGLYAPTDTSPFQWVTGEPFSYSNWAPSEPNFFGQPYWQYVHYWTRDFGSGPSWTWNNEQNEGYDPGNNEYGYLVEFDGPFTPTPEPSTLSLLGAAVVSLGGYGWWRRRGFGLSASWGAAKMP